MTSDKRPADEKDIRKPGQDQRCKEAASGLEAARQTGKLTGIIKLAAA